MSGSIKFLNSNSTPGSRVGVGISSVVGPTGPAGAFGGPQGFVGLQGNQGLIGVQGSQGLYGPQGFVGLQGNQGFVGVQGTQGLIGSTGAFGYQGLQGLQGLIGVQGSQGLIGPQGIAGTTGTNGVQGIIGLQGIAGTTGTNGVQGSQGPAGAGGSGTGSSQWVSSTGGIIYYSSGSVGIGKANPVSTLDVLGNSTLVGTVNKVGNTIMTGALNVSGNITCTNTGSLVNPTFQNYRETVFLGTFGGSYIINCNTGNNFALTMSSGSNSLSFINAAPTGTLTNINLFLTQSASGNCVISWPTSVSWGNPSTPILSTTGSATDLITLTTFTGGSKWLGFLAGRGF